MAVLLVSDLHLDPARPETAALFRRFLAEHESAEALYILGDLFEAWVGDDAIPPAHQRLLEVLRRFAERTPTYVIRGNRDFLLGRGFEQHSGCRLLAEPHTLELGGETTLLLHGDSLCTDDLPYQALRRQLRDPVWQADFLDKPPEARIAMAKTLRERSREAQGEKEAAIMDVNAEAVENAMAEAGATRLIHGHTHRPATHRLTVDGRPAERIVLGEWSTSGTFVRCDVGGCRLHGFP